MCVGVSTISIQSHLCFSRDSILIIILLLFYYYYLLLLLIIIIVVIIIVVIIINYYYVSSWLVLCGDCLLFLWFHFLASDATLGADC